jgi:hypothetical protein
MPSRTGHNFNAMGIFDMPTHRTKRSKSSKRTRVVRKSTTRISRTSKLKPGKRSRGRPQEHSQKIVTILKREQAEQLDAWIKRQPDKPIRAEAVRRLIHLALHPTKPDPAAAPVQPLLTPQMVTSTATRMSACASGCRPLVTAIDVS